MGEITNAAASLEKNHAVAALNRLRDDKCEVSIALRYTHVNQRECVWFLNPGLATPVVKKTKVQENM